MSTRVSCAGILSLTLGLAGCVGQINGAFVPTPDAAPGGQNEGGGGAPATVVFQKLAVTNLPGASENAGVEASFVAADLVPGSEAAPSLSNTVLSAVPGAPPKPLFVGQAQPMDAVLVAVEGQSGYFEVPAGQNQVLGLDLATRLDFPQGTVVLHIATRTSGAVSQAAKLELVIDAHRFVAAGDLENHDSDESNIADLFGAYLEGKAGNPAAPVQVLVGEDNNQIIIDGVKGPSGPVDTGHREVVWDGVPEILRNKGDFKPEFFDRQDNGTAGVRGGIIFAEQDGVGQEVNDALGGALPDPTLVGPPANENAAVGGDFSNHSLNFGGNLLSFTQSASFAPLGTTVTEMTFHVAGSQQKAVVHGMGIVFSSVDKPDTTYVEYLDESGRSVAKIFAPVLSHGPFPFEGPQVADKFSYSFVGFNDLNARIAKVRVVSGDVALDQAQADYPLAQGDVVIFDDVYYSEPRP